MFPGGGTQYVGMGRAALRGRARLPRRDRPVCRALLPAPGARPALAAVRRGGRERAEAACPAHAPAAQHALLFSTEYALAQLLRSLGHPPAAMIGHSLGEYVAGRLAGVLSLEDAVALVVAPRPAV